MGYGLVRVGLTATKIVSDNSKRKMLTLTNASELSIVYIGPDDSITTLNAGALLYPAQSREDVKNIGFWNGPIYGIIGDTGHNAKVYFWEIEL